MKLYRAAGMQPEFLICIHLANPAEMSPAGVYTEIPPGIPQCISPEFNNISWDFYRSPAGFFSSDITLGILKK